MIKYLSRALIQGKREWVLSTHPFMGSGTSLLQSTQTMYRVPQSARLVEEPGAWLASLSLAQGHAHLEPVQVSYQDLVAPLPGWPPMVYGLGLNYASHSSETQMPLPKYPIVIGKAPTCVIGPNQPILVPAVAPLEVDYEVELCIVIGKRCKNVTRQQAHEYVLGFTCANDVSARKWQGKKGGGQWTRAKSFDTFLPIGPSILLQQCASPLGLRTRLKKSGDTGLSTMQDASTKDLVFQVGELVEFLSQDTTLEPWTVILTGTPDGVGYTRQPPVWLQDGDQVEIEIDQVGTLWNPVMNATS